MKITLCRLIGSKLFAVFGLVLLSANARGGQGAMTIENERYTVNIEATGGDVLLGGLRVARVGLTLAGFEGLHVNHAAGGNLEEAVVVDDAGLELERLDDLRGALLVHGRGGVPPQDHRGVAARANS